MVKTFIVNIYYYNTAICTNK